MKIIYIYFFIYIHIFYLYIVKRWKEKEEISFLINSTALIIYKNALYVYLHVDPFPQQCQ